jgi:hypothetical protein
MTLEREGMVELRKMSEIHGLSALVESHKVRRRGKCFRNCRLSSSYFYSTLLVLYLIKTALDVVLEISIFHLKSFSKAFISLIA